MSLSTRALALSAVLVCAGCAHPIVTTPDLVDLKYEDGKQIDKNVGYYISQEDRDKKVITSGGGGDKVAYYPYKELEPALQKALSNIFHRVYPLQAQNDSQAIQAHEIAYVFTPTISTNSSSDSIVTWPPTRFTVALACKAVNAEGKTIWEKQFTGDGTAEFGEYKSDFSIAAKRASQSAFSQFQRAVAQDTQFQK
jgi:hypothetical protein